jgi:transposase-like protein
MEFPITELLDYESSASWILEHFHPKGMHCPVCQKPVTDARKFRRTKKSELTVYRCNDCKTIYNLYTGTVFQGCYWTPMQVVMLLRGISKGETTREMSAELGLNYKTVLSMRHKIQANAEKEQPKTPLPDIHSETDEMFQNAGEKRNTSP